MNRSQSLEWLDTNQHRLAAELARVRTRLESRLVSMSVDAPSLDETLATPSSVASMETPFETSLEGRDISALERLGDELGLSAFEKDVLLLCAGVELDSRFATLCAAAHGDPRRTQATFGLALEILADPHWSALTPAGPLRHWRLVEVGSGETLTSSPLRIDERALHFLVGAAYLDERLQSVFELVPPPAALPASYRAHAERIGQRWSQLPDERPVVQLGGDARGGKRMLAAAVSTALGLRLHVIRASDIPTAATERDALLRLWERESVFSRSALLVDVDDTAVMSVVQAFAERLQGFLFVACTAPLALRHRNVARLEVQRPEADEQHALWEIALGPVAAGLNGELDAIVAQFPLDVESIARVSRAVRDADVVSTPGVISSVLWAECRSQARQPLDRLAQRIEPAATWEEIVLPDEPRQTLREIAAHVRQRARVYGEWGFAQRGERGLGISALFAGPSGTGKTMAAEVLANELQLDLFRIDLSQVVSKYIGETEKTCLPCSTPLRRPARSCCSMKLTRCSANAAK